MAGILAKKRKAQKMKRIHLKIAMFAVALLATSIFLGRPMLLLMANDSIRQSLYQYRRTFLVLTTTAINASTKINSSDNQKIKKIDKNALVPRNEIDLTEYTVLDYACLQVEKPLKSIIVAARTWTNTSNTTNEIHANQQQLQQQEEEPNMIDVRALVGNAFQHHQFHIKYRDEESMTNSTTGTSFEKGAYLLAPHHTPENNFHLHNDFLLPVFRAYQHVNIKGLLLFKGTESRWKTRLPIVNSVLSAMDLKVTYPMENITQERCFERLVIERITRRPYYTHEGRFSSFWPERIFVDYRDKVNAYFRDLLVSMAYNSTTNNRSNDNQTVDRSTAADHEAAMRATTTVASTYNEPNATAPLQPILSWVSRSCGRKKGRCIANEREVALELSKYFRVNFIDFTDNQRFSTIEKVMEAVMETNVLVGLHGAGLGSTCLLPKNAMLVELRGNFGSEKKMFLNMASTLDLPYYAADVKQWGQKNDVYTIPDSDIARIALQIYEAWKFENETASAIASATAGAAIATEQSTSSFTGECSFPPVISPAGHLSNTTYSRCYLESNRKTKYKWSQCVVFDC